MEIAAEKHKAEPTNRKAPMYRVLVHNDPVTKAVFVVRVLMVVFRKTEETAYSVMKEAHESGVALVDVMCLEQAELRVDMARSMIQSEKCPLRFSIEPE
jgi:ATP-dependent Clp protease adaptor protein ClpS